MLATLLPGLREIRAPIAAGFLWLGTLWVVFGDFLRINGKNVGLIANLIALGNWLDKAVLLGIIAFAAYLIGVISVSINAIFYPKYTYKHWQYKSLWSAGSFAPNQAIKANIHLPGTKKISEPLYHRLRKDRIERLINDPEFRENCIQSIHHAIDWQRGRYEGLRLALPTEEITTSLFDRNLVFLRSVALNLDCHANDLRSLISSLDATAHRLIGVDSDLYSDFDRTKAEAEFRISTAIPLTLMVVAVSWKSSWLALALLILPLALLVVGRKDHELAYQKLVLWILAGRVKSPELEAILLKQPEIFFSVTSDFIRGTFFYDEKHRSRRGRQYTVSEEAGAQQTTTVQASDNSND
jgi:hypothetical protein